MQNNTCTEGTKSSRRKLTQSDIIALRRDPPFAMSRLEAAYVLGISLRLLADLIAKGKIRATRVGDRRIVRRTDLEAFLAK